MTDQNADRINAATMTARHLAVRLDNVGNMWLDEAARLAREGDTEAAHLS